MIVSQSMYKKLPLTYSGIAVFMSLERSTFFTSSEKSTEIISASFASSVRLPVKPAFVLLSVNTMTSASFM